MCLTVFTYLIYDIPESRMRPIAFGAIDMPRYRSKSLEAILTGVERWAGEDKSLHKLVADQ